MGITTGDHGTFVQSADVFSSIDTAEIDCTWEVRNEVGV